MVLGVWDCLIGGFFCFGTGEGMGWDGREGEKLAAGWDEVGGGGLDVSRDLGCLEFGICWDFYCG